MPGQGMKDTRGGGHQAVDLGGRLVGLPLDLLALLGQRLLHPQKCIDIITIPALRRDAPRAGVRLGQITEILEIGHHRSHGRRGDVDLGTAGDGMAAHRLAALDVVADDRAEHAASAIVEHVLPLSLRARAHL